MLPPARCISCNVRTSEPSRSSNDCHSIRARACCCSDDNSFTGILPSRAMFAVRVFSESVTELSLVPLEKDLGRCRLNSSLTA